MATYLAEHGRHFASIGSRSEGRRHIHLDDSHNSFEWGPHAFTSMHVVSQQGQCLEYMTSLVAWRSLVFMYILLLSERSRMTVNAKGALRIGAASLNKPYTGSPISRHVPRLLVATPQSSTRPLSLH